MIHQGEEGYLHITDQMMKVLPCFAHPPSRLCSPLVQAPNSLSMYICYVCHYLFLSLLFFIYIYMYASMAASTLLLSKMLQA